MLERVALVTAEQYTTAVICGFNLLWFQFFFPSEM